LKGPREKNPNISIDRLVRWVRRYGLASALAAAISVGGFSWMMPAEAGIIASCSVNQRLNLAADVSQAIFNYTDAVVPKVKKKQYERARKNLLKVSEKIRDDITRDAVYSFIAALAAKDYEEAQFMSSLALERIRNGGC